MSVLFHVVGRDEPLEVLLGLIQKNEVSIYDIPISLITEQFLDYIHTQEEVGLKDLSDFYKMAADLLWIKSQILLPKEPDFGDEYYEDPREELVERLLEYSKFKKYSQLLEGSDREGGPMIIRKPSQFMMPFSDQELWEDVDVEDLLSTFIKLLKGKISDEKVYNVYEQVTEQEKLALMFEMLETRESICFTDLFTKDSSPMHVICAFLALLDAVKDKSVLVEQDSSFSDIIIRKRPTDWNPNLADDYDDEYDAMEAENGVE